MGVVEFRLKEREKILVFDFFAETTIQLAGFDCEQTEFLITGDLVVMGLVVSMFQMR